MKTVRVILFLVACAIVLQVATILRDDAERTPQTVLAQARAMLDLEQPNFNGAVLTIEQGLGTLKQRYTPLELAPLALERMHIYRTRWDRSMKERQIAHEPGDLRQVLRETFVFIEQFDESNSKVLFLGTQAALEMQLYPEAKELAERLLESSPSPEVRAQAQRCLGQVSVARGDLELEELLAGELDQTPERRVERRTSAKRVALMHTSAPGEEEPFNDLQSSLSAPAASLAARHITRAAAAYARATEHFLQALELFPDEGSVVGLQRLSLAAGAFNDVIDLGRMALSRRDLIQSTSILSLELRALKATGRTEEALALLKERTKLSKEFPLDYASLSSAELNELCLFLLELGDPRTLSRAASSLRERIPNIDEKLDYARLGYFYILLTRVALSRFENLKGVIQRGEPRQEIYEGQRMEYFAAVAQVYSAEANFPNAMRMLAKAVKFAPFDPTTARMRQVTGEMWKSLGELHLKLGNTADAEAPLAHALCFIPDPDGSLLASYSEAGEAAIRSHGRHRSRVLKAPLGLNESGELPRMGPFEACLRAEACLAAEQPYQVGFLLAKSLGQFPGLPPAIELEIRAALGRGETRQALELLLQLEERKLATPRARALLSTVPSADYGPAQIQRMLQYEAGSEALDALLQRCAARGEHQRLLQIIAGQRASELSQVSLLLGVGVHLDQHEVAAAERLFKHVHLGADEHPRARGCALRLAAALLSNKRSAKRGEQLLGSLRPAAGIRYEALTQGIDELLAGGHIDLAREALERAETDAQPLAPELLLRWAWSGALAGHAYRDSDALEALERAEPYLASGQADFTRLLMYVDAGDLAGAEGWAKRLLHSAFATGQLERALFQVLAHEPQAAQESLRLWQLGRGPKPKPVDAMDSLALQLLRAALPAEGDQTQAPAWALGDDAAWYGLQLPRAMSMLLASRTPDFSAWVLARAQGLKPALQGSPLYAVLRANAWKQLGFYTRAESELEAFTKPGRPEVQAWMLREELAETALTRVEGDQRGKAQAHLDKLRKRRLENLGPLGDSAARVALIRARTLNSEGRAEEAAQYIDKIRQLWPNDPELLTAAARLARRRRALALAYDHYQELLEKHGSRARSVLREVLQVCTEQEQSGELSPQAHRARIEGLTALLPRDPSLPLLLAKLQMQQSGSSSAWNSARALERLERFRTSTQGEPLEGLAAGTASKWVAFIARFDLPQALKLSYQELQAQPENPALWRLWLEIMVRSGDLGRARNIHNSIQAIFNDPGLKLAHGVLLMDSGIALPRGLQRSLEQLAEGKPEVELRLALAGLGPRTRPNEREAIRKASLESWQQRARLKLPLATTARLLMRTLGPRDEALANVLGEALSENQDPRARQLLRGLLQLNLFPAQVQDAG